MSQAPYQFDLDDDPLQYRSFKIVLWAAGLVFVVALFAALVVFI
ncbi:MAG TPA: hypothetical protein VHZ24_14565 [Pirellulales bacterium]|jgi:hypothetical protein|nr:hypothetical protein [Pirellulales bacterium]